MSVCLWDSLLRGVDNAEWYCRRRQPFVMGTTGGDREKLMRGVEDSKVYSVIAAQMGKQVSEQGTAQSILVRCSRAQSRAGWPG